MGAFGRCDETTAITRTHALKKGLYQKRFWCGPFSCAWNPSPAALTAKGRRRGRPYAEAPALLDPARKGLRMLWPVTTGLRPSVAFSRPLSENLVKPRLRLMSPNTVSTSTERLFLGADPTSERSISLARLSNALKVGLPGSAWESPGPPTSSTSPCARIPSSPRTRGCAPCSCSPGRTPASTP